MNTKDLKNKNRFRMNLLEFSRKAKVVGLFSVVLTIFFDSSVLSLLSLLALFAFVEIALEYSVYKDSFLQYLGMLIIKFKHGSKIPSIDNYQNEVEYTLPFEGKWTVINGGYTKEQSHSWGVPTQRYAYDFVIMDDQGKTHQGDYGENQNYYCYDKNILAPATGKVVEVFNQAEDSLIYKPGKFLSRSSHIAGNYVVIQHTDQEYSTLAHLKKDSITVRPGDKVSRGEVIGKCGNTGNSTEPHLHFQLQGGQSFYNSVGLPVAFKNFGMEVPENYENIDPRPRLSKDEVKAGYITRGFVVYNKT